MKQRPALTHRYSHVTQTVKKTIAFYDAMARLAPGGGRVWLN